MGSRLTGLLHCDVPIQLAPMGSVSATPALPLAVALAGGHAVYPALALPPVALEPVVDALARQTRAFGVNFLVPLMDRASLELAAEHAPYVDFFLAEPDPALVGLVRDGGALCGWQIESAEEARAAEAAGCDLVIAKGWESGGRKRIEGPTLLPLLDAVLDAVSLPVIAAGGIATARGVAAVLAGGADGARVGTRFIAAKESDAHPAWIRAVVQATAEDAVVTTAFNTGMPGRAPHRVLRSSIEAAEDLDDEHAGVVRLAGAEIPAPRFGPMPPTRESTGTIEAMPFYAGQSAGAVTAIEPAADIVADLATGAVQLEGGAAAGLHKTIPALPVRDVRAAVAHYRERFGFEAAHETDGFAVLVRDDAVLHLWGASDEAWRSRHDLSERPISSGAESFLGGTASCRIEVTDVDVLFAELKPAGVLHTVSRGGVGATDFGTREFATVDLDGNLLAFFHWEEDR